ncbi:MAG: peptidase T, partial [Planctomycetota bacterium]
MQNFDRPGEILEQTRIVEQFLDCVRFDTQSDEASETCPSTSNQLELGRHLVGRLKELGLGNATMSEHGYVLAELPGNADGAIGLCAHLDTAPAFSGTGVKPQLHEHYDCTPIRLKEGVVIDPAESPELLQCQGDTIITADGTTLLGADDKAGIAAILGALEVLRDQPGIRHPTLKICFNPD